MFDENNSVCLSAISISASRLSTTTSGARNTGVDSRSALYIGCGSARPATVWFTNPSVSVMPFRLTPNVGAGIGIRAYCRTGFPTNAGGSRGRKFVSVERCSIECMFESLAIVDPASEESALIERIAELERVKAAAAAGQARAAAALDAARRAADAAAGVPAARRGRGVASEVALARLDSPARGNRHLGFAKALVHEMPHTLAALEAGVLTEWRATLIVRESACLDVDDRRTLDAELCGDQAELQGMGDAAVAAAAKTIAYRLDPHAVVDRAAKAETERTVTIRPAPDTMTYLTALLPVAQGVSVYAALRREADVCADGRSRGQVMADTLVERTTGRSAAAATPIAVNLVLSDETLFGGVQRACHRKRLRSHPGGRCAGFGFRRRQ